MVVPIPFGWCQGKVHVGSCKVMQIKLINLSIQRWLVSRSVLWVFQAIPGFQSTIVKNNKFSQFSPSLSAHYTPARHPIWIHLIWSFIILPPKRGARAFHLCIQEIKATFDLCDADGSGEIHAKAVSWKDGSLPKGDEINAGFGMNVLFCSMWIMWINYGLVIQISTTKN